MAGLAEKPREALLRFWYAWNGVTHHTLHWENFWQYRPVLAQHAVNWRTTLNTIGDLGHQLVTFCQTQMRHESYNARL